MAGAAPKRHKRARRCPGAPYYHFLINEDLDQAVHSAQGIAEHDDSFSQIDKSYRVWVERILHDLKSHS